MLNNGFPQEDMEVLVVDGGSADQTRAIVNQLSETYPQLRLIDNPKKKTPFALNLGIENAHGEYILIASAHSSFDKGYIQTLFAEMETLNADVIGGVMETKIKNETPTAIAIKRVLSHKFGVGNATFRVGTKEAVAADTVPFGLYKTALLQSINGYDERLIRNHDIEMSKRILALGSRIFLTPKAKCYYYARETWSKLAKNNFDNGKWNLITAYYTKNLASLSLRHFVPLFFVLSLLVPTVLGLLFWPFILLALLSFGLYFLTLILVISKMDKKGTSFFHLLWTFIVLHMAYGIGSFIGLFHFSKYFRA